nr:MAG TPA: hypothetical protein [Crassvirales sp.]
MRIFMIILMIMNILIIISIVVIWCNIKNYTHVCARTRTHARIYI